MRTTAAHEAIPADKPRRGAEVSPLHRIDEELQLGQFIPLHYHGQMLADGRRMGAFSEAIAKLVPEGANVVELGAGTGVMSFFASKRARKVTCVERLPHVAAAARRLLAANGVSDKVTVVDGDARSFVPDEPVDVLICELLHTGLLREQQAAVVAQFKAMHEERFGRPVTLILPEASILAVQPVYQPFDFHGYHAPVPLFMEPGSVHADTVEMGPPEIYAFVVYRDDYPTWVQVGGTLAIELPGTVNALRFVTKNVVGILESEGRSTDWHMQYLIMPLPQPVELGAGDALEISFQYEFGGSIESLLASLSAKRAEPGEPAE
jgi:type I protein arginine methyltransferase